MNTRVLEIWGNWGGIGGVYAIFVSTNVKQNFNAQGIDYEQIAGRVVIPNLIFSVTSRGEMNFRWSEVTEKTGHKLRQGLTKIYVHSNFRDNEHG